MGFRESRVQIPPSRLSERESAIRSYQDMHAQFSALLQFADTSLLLLRLMVAGVFFDSGWNHLKHPVQRANSIGASTGFTIFLGTAEVLGSVGVALGILTQLATLGLSLIMLGAIQKKLSSCGRPAFGAANRTAGIMT